MNITENTRLTILYTLTQKRLDLIDAGIRNHKIHEPFVEAISWLGTLGNEEEQEIEIPWQLIPSHMKWVAVSADGSLCGFVIEPPAPLPGIYYWTGKPLKKENGEMIMVVIPLGKDWRTCKYKRVEEKWVWNP